MPELLTARNYDEANILANTEILEDVLPSQDQVPAENTASFAVGKYIVVGQGETAEIQQIESFTDQNIVTVDNLKFKHYKGEPIRLLLGNVIRFFYAANVDGSEPALESFTLLAEVAIVPDQLSTSHLHAAGGSGWWYKFIYYDNYNDSDYTDLEDSVAVRGGASNAYVTVQAVREEAGLQNNPHIVDHFILSKIVKAQSEVNASLAIAGYTLPLTSVPGIVENATLLIAAGYLLLTEYGPENSGTNKEGNQKLAEGRKLLLKLEGGGQTLVDDSGNSINRSNKIAGYPDGTNSSHGPMFRITDKF